MLRYLTFPSLYSDCLRENAGLVKVSRHLLFSELPIVTDLLLEIVYMVLFTYGQFHEYSRYFFEVLGL